MENPPETESMVTDGNLPTRNDGKGKTRVLEFEDIIESLGSFGHWQRVIFILISSADVFGGMCMLIPVFIGDVPRWRCARFQNQNATWWSEDQGNVTDLGVCERNGTRCVEFQFMDDFTSIIGEWSLVCDKDYLSDVISSFSVGAAIFGQLSDRFGRKRMYYLAFTIQIGSGMLSAACMNWQMYAVCRFGVGVGFGAYMVINCVYPLEFVGHAWRMLCGTIGFWAIGIMMLAGTAYLIRDWRYLTAATSVSGLTFFCTWWYVYWPNALPRETLQTLFSSCLSCFRFIPKAKKEEKQTIWRHVPESPRWLVQQRRYEEAKDILNIIAKKNDRPPTSESVLRQFAESDEAEKKELKKYSYLDLFKQWKYAKRTLIMGLLWFTTQLVYYEISFNLKNISGDRYLNMFMGGSVDLAAMVIVLLSLNRIGRKISMVMVVVVTFVAILSILALIITDRDSTFPNLILGLALAGKSSGLAGIYGVQIFSAELFPTVIRTVGLGSGSICGRIGGTLAPLLVYMGRLNKLAPYIVVLIMAGVSMPFVFLLPETNGKPLEDTYNVTAYKPSDDGYEEAALNAIKDTGTADSEEDTDYVERARMREENTTV